MQLVCCADCWFSDVFWRGQIVFDTWSGTGLVGSNQPFSVIRKSDIANGLGERYEDAERHRKTDKLTKLFVIWSLRSTPSRNRPVQLAPATEAAVPRCQRSASSQCSRTIASPRSVRCRGNPRECEGQIFVIFWGIFGDRATEFRMTNSTKTYWE